VFPVDLGDLTEEETNDVDQAAMSALGTVQRGAFGYNHVNVHRMHSWDYFSAQRAGAALIDGDPLLKGAIDTLVNRVLAGSDVADETFYDQYVDVWRFELSMPFGPSPTMGVGDELDSYMRSNACPASGGAPYETW
jgi:hypothetical protein